MSAIIVLVILAAGTGWLLWGHLKNIEAEDFERNLAKRISNKQSNEPHNDDLKSNEMK